MKATVKANDEFVSNKSSIIGTYEGECADATITNENGLDITREVWENVFNSEDYARGIQYGWLIGFLGHPEDPGCQEFEKGCIVMTEGGISDDGKVYGKFNLINTPVGRVVKTFIDAGVKFGISVRGAGDIINNSVDPDTFVFRGFDLVAYPAYPESIPSFTEIAASTDAESRSKYKKICAAIHTELDNITSIQALDVIQSQFANQSDEYAAIEERKQELLDNGIEDSELEDINDSKVECVTKLYVESVAACKELEAQLHEAMLANTALKKYYSRKINSMKRISTCQLQDLDDENTELSANYDEVVKENTSLKDRVAVLSSQNLKYKRKINSNSREVESKNDVIASLQSKLDETVVGIRAAKTDAFNRDEQIQHLKAEIKACKATLSNYQQAYSQLYAKAIGVDFNIQPITASTSVEDLQRQIKSNSSKQIVESSFADPIPVSIEETIVDEDDLITM